VRKSSRGIARLEQPAGGKRRTDPKGDPRGPSARSCSANRTRPAHGPRRNRDVRPDLTGAATSTSLVAADLLRELIRAASEVTCTWRRNRCETVTVPEALALRPFAFAIRRYARHQTRKRGCTSSGLQKQIVKWAAANAGGQVDSALIQDVAVEGCGRVFRRRARSARRSLLRAKRPR